MNTSTIIPGVAFLLLVVIVLGVLTKTGKGKAGAQKHAVAYRLKGPLMSRAERSFYGVLVHAVGVSGLVFGKVRVADVLTPQKGRERAEWQRAFNAISAKHLDFLVCDPADCAIRFAVELDDASHNSAKVQQRDLLLDAACRSAGLPLMRVKAARGYVVADLEREIAQLLGLSTTTLHNPVSTVEEEISTVRSEKPAAAAAQPVAAQPPCPKCAAPMVLRRSNAKRTIGERVWGCSRFPSCRGIMPCADRAIPEASTPEIAASKSDPHAERS